MRIYPKVIILATVFLWSLTIWSQTATLQHTVKKGESLYGIARQYGVSQEEIINLNPSASSGLKAGQTLQIPTNDNTVANSDSYSSTSVKDNADDDNSAIIPSDDSIVEKEQTAQSGVVTSYRPYKVKKGDTFASIAAECSVSESDLRAANPDVSKPKRGMTLYVPVIEVQEEESVIATQPESDVAKDDTLRVAIVLPFNLTASEPTKTAKLYTEFYKGFLIALDEIRKDSNKPINIYAYDSSAGIDYEALRMMNLIFAPDNEEQIKRLAEIGDNTGALVVNAFVVHSDLWTSHSSIYQVNAPQSVISEKVINWIEGHRSNCEVIFLVDNSSEQKETASQIKDKLNTKPWREVTVSGRLNSDTLSASLEFGKHYIFIPTTGSRRTLSRILPALAKTKENRPDVDITLLGYPEWTTYLDDFGNQMSRACTTIYSRFFYDPSNSKVADFEEKMQRWYGEHTMAAAPRFGLLGYDCGRYFLKALIDGDFDFNKRNRYNEGLQSGFKPLKAETTDGGVVNTAVYFIELSPGSNSIKKTLK